MIDQKVAEEKSQVQEKLIPFCVLCEHTFAARWNQRSRVGGPSQKVHL